MHTMCVYVKCQCSYAKGCLKTFLTKREMHMRRVIILSEGSSATDNALDDTYICIYAAAVDTPNSKLTADDDYIILL